MSAAFDDLRDRTQRAHADAEARHAEAEQRDRPAFYDAAALAGADIKPPEFVVTGLLPVGLTILAARPKLGKTLLAANIALAVAAGRPFGGRPTRGGPVLWLDLEGSPWRAKQRLETMLAGAPIPAGIQIAHAWPRLDDGGLAELDKELGARPGTRLAIVDTFGRVKPPAPKGADPYLHEVQTIGDLSKLAHRHGVALLAVLHSRKGADPDPLNELHGSVGISGSADALLILRRERGSADASLYVTGRDVEDQDLALAFDKGRLRWSIQGSAAEARMNETRRKLFDALANAGRPMKPRAAAEEADVPYELAKKTLQRMLRDGSVVCRDGAYAPAAV